MSFKKIFFIILSALFFIFPDQVLAVAPRVKATQLFPLGIFEDRNKMSDVATFTSMLTDMKTRGMDSVLFTNGTSDAGSILSVSDSMNMNIVWSSMYHLYNDYYYNFIPRNIETVRPIVQGIVNETINHPSVVGYNIVDDASWQWADKIADVVQAFKEVDPMRPAIPVIVGSPNTEKVAVKSNPAISLTYNYPVRRVLSPCGFANGDFSNYALALRNKIQYLPPDSPIWMILQTHQTNGNTVTNLRMPTVEELRIQNWISIGEGVKGIFWFAYTTQQSWIGLKDNTILMNEITDLTRRVSPLRPLLLKTKRVNDKFYTKSTKIAYISTLFDQSTNKYYAVIVNHDCSPQNIQIYSNYFNGQLKNLEDNSVVALGSSVNFRGGDGKIFELINPSDKTVYQPLRTKNLIANGSFEQILNNRFVGFLPMDISVISQDLLKTKDGNASVKFSPSTSVKTLTQFLYLKPNTVYTFSYWSQLNTELNNINTRPVIYLQDSTLLNVYSIISQLPHTSWQRNFVIFKTPDGPFSLQRMDINSGLLQGQNWWIDGMVLCEGKGECTGKWPTLGINDPVPGPNQCQNDTNNDKWIDGVDYVNYLKQTNLNNNFNNWWNNFEKGC